jgi:ATP-binding cassette, subfamily B, multidrug efflux pump
MKTFLRLGPYLRPYRLQVLLSLLTLISLTAIGLVVPIIIRYVIDVGINGGEISFLINTAFLLIGLGFLRAVLNYFQRYLSEWIATHIGFDLRNRLYNHIQHLPFSFHDHMQSGQLISRCIEDVRAIERFTGFGVVELIRVVLLMVVIGFILFYQQPYLAFISLLPLVPLILMTFDFGKKISSLFYVVDNTLGELSSRLQENVVGVQVVRAFTREDYEKKRFQEQNKALYDARLTVLNKWSRLMPTTNFLVGLSTILVIFIGGWMVIRGQMTVGEVVEFNAYILMMAGPAQQLAWLVNSAGEAVAGVKRTNEILDIKPSIQSSSDAIVLPTIKGEVEFIDVSLQYSGENAAALESINLVVPQNHLVALIGPTGSGKTSLVNLIPRFYDVNNGTVKVDGVDVREVNLLSLRKQIGIVLQSSLLFSTTIRENIAFGRPDASLEEVVAAAKAAQAHDFIEELTEGYETVVGERGVTLSGGQRQRVAIARALLMDPRILILDDSTSSVDTETEQLIQGALNTLMQGRTTFVIAHRLSTVRRADLTIVLDQGRIVQRGTHQQLLAEGGLYREIHDLQLMDEEQFREDMLSLQPDGEKEIDRLSSAKPGTAG